MPLKTQHKRKKQLNLALQGGGAHGAFAWGVLDRLLDEDDIDIKGISGTSAGAMNGAMLVSGLARGGVDGARQTLHDFWRDVSAASAMSIGQSPLGGLAGNYNLENSPGYAWMNLMTQVFSPYQLNPLNYNPLKDILERYVDPAALQASDTTELFVAATSVRTGHARVFQGGEIDSQVLLASACIPFLFQAVEIDGEPYWDGGYVGNPVIWPLIYYTDTTDVLLVQINPLSRDEVPQTAYQIINRLNEITFNSSLIAEMRAINFVSKMIHENRLDTHKYRDVRMHMVAAGPKVKDLDASSKMNANWDFFLYLKEHGREQMDAWLKANKADIGKRATLDIQQTFLDKPRSSNTSRHVKPVRKAR